MESSATVFCGRGVWGAVRAAESHFDRREKTPEQIMKEALGKAPVDNTGTPAEREMARINREFIADMLATRKKHDADAAALGPALGTLYTASSFANKRSMGEAAAAVKKILDVDAL